MPIVHADDVKESLLRFEFEDSVVSLPLADAATFQDVALTFRDLSRGDHGDLVSIVVVLKSGGEAPAEVMTA
jgi:hypothetical protein